MGEGKKDADMEGKREGMEGKGEQHEVVMPLDVSYARFADWLVERRVLPLSSSGNGGASSSGNGGWRTRVAALRQRSKRAAEEAAGLFTSKTPTALLYATTATSNTNNSNMPINNDFKKGRLPDFIDCRKILAELKAVLEQQKRGNEIPGKSEATTNSSLFSMMSSAVGLNQAGLASHPLSRLIGEFENILKSYGQDNMYLGEAAIMMVQVIE